MPHAHVRPLKNGFVLCHEKPKSIDSHVNEQGIRTEGITLPSGITLPPSTAELRCDFNAHEVVVFASRAPDLPPGTRVLINLEEVSAFFPGEEGEGTRCALPQHEVWLAIEPDEEGRDRLRVRGKHVVVERDPGATKTLQGATSIILPESVARGGVSVSGDEDPTKGGERERDSVTAMAGTIRFIGPDVERFDVYLEDKVVYSPSYCCTRLEFDGRRYEVIPADEIFYAIEPDLDPSLN